MSERLIPLTSSQSERFTIKASTPVTVIGDTEPGYERAPCHAFHIHVGRQPHMPKSSPVEVHLEIEFPDPRGSVAFRVTSYDELSNVLQSHIPLDAGPKDQRRYVAQARRCLREARQKLQPTSDGAFVAGSYRDRQEFVKLLDEAAKMLLVRQRTLEPADFLPYNSVGSMFTSDRVSEKRLAWEFDALDDAGRKQLVHETILKKAGPRQKVAASSRSGIHYDIFFDSNEQAQRPYSVRLTSPDCEPLVKGYFSTKQEAVEYGEALLSQRSTG